ncbi:MAG: MFS transporter [Rhodocyclaceae bacterium]
MSRSELSVAGWLALVFGFRMLGLFLVLPVFSLYAKTLPGGDNIMWAGIAMGAFALTQAVLQIPFGFASDRWGRKPVIVLGLLLYAVGSVLAAYAPNIGWLTAARCLQGAGAISAAVTALAADLTREEHRTKTMAIIGVSIGVVFAVSLVAAPALYSWIGMHGMFLLIAALALGAIGVVTLAVPHAPRVHVGAPDARLRDVLFDTQLLRLDFGIFSKHLMQMAMFLVVPRLLVDQQHIPVEHHWMLYLPVVFGGFVLAAPAIMQAERRSRMKPVFMGSISVIALSQLGLLLAYDHFVVLVAMLFLFFVAFNFLEASMPSLVSRIAPPHAKGLALGAFNTSQALGAGLGAAAGGMLALHFGPQGVFGASLVLSLLWALWAKSMVVPSLSARREYHIAPHLDLIEVREQIARLPGVREVVLEPQRRIAVLKVNPERWDESRLRTLIGGEV